MKKLLWSIMIVTTLVLAWYVKAHADVKAIAKCELQKDGSYLCTTSPDDWKDDGTLY